MVVSIMDAAIYVLIIIIGVLDYQITMDCIMLAVESISKRVFLGRINGTLR